MATKKKLLQAAAGNAGGAGLNVEEVFSTYLYNGAGGTGVIVDNGIDLAGEGGMVWIKARTSAEDHVLFDTERGVTKLLESNTNLAEQTNSGTLTNFYSDGFRVDGNGTVGSSTDPYASWTFRKAPKFFDIVTYTGTGSAQNISHNLGSVPACIITKRTDASENWLTYHRGLDATAPEDKYIMLNRTNAVDDASTIWNDTAPTGTEFTVGSANTNTSGGTYVAYIFAHNDGDGGFGPDGDADIIKCGSYTGSGSSGNFVDLGFEPQWVLIKDASRSEGWFLWDTMRGIATDGSNFVLRADLSNAEQDFGNIIDVASTGFIIKAGNSFPYNYSGDTYIYIAIRRGPMAVPESGTDVFAPAVQYNETTDLFNSGFVTDMLWYRNPSSSDEMRVLSRLTQGKTLRTDQTTAETGNTTTFDFMNGADSPVNDSFRGWMWKRASKYFDVVAYTGDGTTARAISHNLGVPPQLMIHKRRNATNDWYVPDFINSKILLLNYNLAAFDTSILANYYGSGNGSSGGASSVVIPDASTFTVTPNINVNASGGTYIAYLFASLDGISKVGSVTHSGTTNVDCGFTSGARFILLKRTDSTGDWYVWDSTRGIVSGNDPYLLLNTTAAEVTNTDYIDPLSSGFTITSSFTAGDYIFYAVS